MIYYLNPRKQSESSGGNFEVHTDACKHAPDDKGSLIYLGNYGDARSAVLAAKREYLYMAVDIDGCYFCCRSENKEKEVSNWSFFICFKYYFIV